jgi:hypothetical protein
MMLGLAPNVATEWSHEVLYREVLVPVPAELA